VINNVLHTNTTTEQYTFVYYYFLQHVSAVPFDHLELVIQVHEGKVLPREFKQ